MPKKTKPTKSKLTELLEQGKPIKGLIGYIELTDFNSDDVDTIEDVYMKVKCLDIVIEHNTVYVRVEVCSGQSTFTITPDKIIPSPKEMSIIKDKRIRHKQAEKDFAEIAKSYYLAKRREVLREYVMKNLLPEDQKQFWQAINDECPGVKYEKLNSREICKYAGIAVCVRNKLEEQNPEEFGRYNW